MSELPEQLDTDERRFLLSIASNRPEWGALGIEHLEQVPALRWKLQNIQRLEQANRRKFEVQLEALARGLAG